MTDSPNVQQRKCWSAGNFDRIKVYLRMRPLLLAEKPIDYTVSENTITVHPSPFSTGSAFCVDKSFSFRAIMDQTSTQDDVFQTVVSPLLDNFINGEDILIFCYGSTNAGKTFTITGSKRNPGVLKRSLDSILGRVHPHDLLDISVVEIYNEIIFDLLDQTNIKEPKKLCSTKTGETEVHRAVEHRIKSIDDVNLVLERTENLRHRGSTELNLESSRSHTIFRIKLTHRQKSCWLSIVDLAGCERLSVINSTVGSFKEACNINKSMLVLGKCIRQLKEQTTSSRKLPIPYRESKLTHLFKSFFEPKHRVSQASIIINTSPSMMQFEDTVFALQFAAEAAQCVIRQTQRVSSERVEEEEEEHEETVESRETPEEMEARIRKQVCEEMEKVLQDKEQQMGRILQEMRQIGRSFPKPRAVLCGTIEQTKNDLRKSIECLEVELNELMDARASVLAQNRELRGRISAAMGRVI
jgi:hypothetical protein